MKNYALIVAAGRGTRMGHRVPKQYLEVAGREILGHTMMAFQRSPDIDKICVVIHRDDVDRFLLCTTTLKTPKLLPYVIGGDSRTASVKAGLEALRGHAPDTVLIHDAARPFCPQGLISEVCETLRTKAGAVAALPVVDALWRADQLKAREPIPRENTWRAQTPQGFQFEPILSAYENLATQEANDDVAIAVAAGLDVVMVEGSEDNFKITTPKDLTRAEDVVRHREGEAER